MEKDPDPPSAKKRFFASGYVRNNQEEKQKTAPSGK